MPKESQGQKRPRDTNQLAKHVVELATGEVTDASESDKKDADSAASQLGRLGGLKGGKARARALTPEQRREIAQRAAAARWKK